MCLWIPFIDTERIPSAWRESILIRYESYLSSRIIFVYEISIARHLHRTSKPNYTSHGVWHFLVEYCLDIVTSVDTSPVVGPILCMFYIIGSRYCIRGVRYYSFVCCEIARIGKPFV